MLWKSNLWPNLLWYHEEPVSSNHCNPWHGCSAGFPRALARRGPRGSRVTPSEYIWAPPLTNLGIIHRQLSGQFVILLKSKWCGQSYYVWKGSSSEDLCGTGWFEMCGKKWDATKTGQFSVRAIIAVYLPVVHSSWPWQQLGWNQVTGWVVRGGTCLSNFSPVGAVVAWADSQRAKMAGFWYSPFGPSLLSFKKRKQGLFWCVAENIALSILLCKAREGRKCLQVRNAHAIGWKTGNCSPRSLHCCICQGKILTKELLLYQKKQSWASILVVLEITVVFLFFLILSFKCLTWKY